LTRARLLRALEASAAAVALHGPAARPLFLRLEAELAAFDAAQAEAEQVDARAATLAANLVQANRLRFTQRASNA
jgi:hypothetical protein